MTRSETPITTRMSCSIISTVSSALVAQLLDERGEVRGLLRVHAGGRLVEQQQLRLGGERARDLEPALVAVRAGSSRSRPPCARRPGVLEQLERALARLAPPRAAPAACAGSS